MSGGSHPGAAGDRGPRPRSLRRLALALASAGVVLLASLSATGRLSLELAHARLLFAPPSAPLEDPAPLLAHPPAPGTYLHVRARVRCAITALEEAAPPWLACPVRWGGERKLPAVSRDPALERLWDASAIEAEEVKRANADGDGAEAKYAIRHVPALAALVQRTCREGAAEPCARFRETMTAKVVFPDAAAHPTWDALLDAATRGGGAARGSEQAGPMEEAITDEFTIGTLRGELQEIVRARELERYGGPARDAMESQRGGVRLRVWPEIRLPPSAPAPNDGALPHLRTSERWAEFERRDAAPAPYEIRGLLAEVSRDERGDLVLDIDTGRTPENAYAAALRLSALGGATALLLVLGAASVLKVGRARRPLHGRRPAP